MIPVPLTTERLVLDLPTLDDLDAIVEYCRDPLFERVLTTPWPYSREHAEGFVSGFVPVGWRTGTQCVWAVRASAGGPLLGVIDVRATEGDAWMVGYWVGAPHRGHGYIPEALGAVVDWAFANGLTTRIEWEAYLGNAASAISARKAGFAFRGERTAHVPARDGSAPVVWWAELGIDDDRTPKPGWPA